MNLRRLNPNAVVGGGFAALLALALTVGALMGWSVAVRLALVTGVLVVALVVLVVRLFRADRNARGIEQVMRVQADKQRLGARPDRQGEIRQLQEQFDRALKTLKESKLVRGRRGAEALYALPWYLFVGPPAAGKTTAIAHSGLRFPLGTNRVRGVGGTRNCDWFFADSAILLDTAGRYMVEDEDAEEWGAFLSALRKHRRHQPINGVLVGMSAADLAQMSAADVEMHADAFRQRLDELVRRLGVQFPVYLVITKCDLLLGFVEFFGDLTKAEREQVWGATLELDDERAPADAFAEELDLLLDALFDERIARLARAMKREERQAVYAFPLEVAALREHLALFVDQLFLENPYQDSPRFRGFYLTSGTQEGAPIDRVISAIADELGLAPEPAGAPRYDLETKSYFLKDLFTDVVVPDQHLVRRTATGPRTPWAAVAAGVGLLAFAVLLLLSARRSQADIRAVEGAAAALDGGVPVGSASYGGPAPVQAVGRLDALHGAVAKAREGGWRLYDRDDLLRPADALWLARTRAFVGVHGVDVLEERLARWLAVTRDGATGEEWKGLDDDLQAYLLLTSEARRLGGEGDSAQATRAFLRRHLQAVALTHGAAPRADQAPIARVYGAFAAALGERRTGPFEADVPLRQRAQAALARAPAADRIYVQIRREGERRFMPLSPLDMAGDGGAVFAGGAAVEGVFTQEAWAEYVRPAIEDQSRRPIRADWVVGRVLQADADEAGDLEAQLRARYFRDYAEAWERFLGDLRYRPVSGPAGAAERMALLGDAGSSPTALVLARVADETDFGLSAPEPASDPAEASAVPVASAGGVPPPGAAPRVEPGAEGLVRQFAWLHALQPELVASRDGAPELSAVFDAMADLGIELEAGGNGAEVGLLQYQQAVRRLRMEPGLRERLFEDPAVAGSAAAEGAAAGAAAAALNSEWAPVYGFYHEHLRRRYPFEATADEDALLDDVTTFFHPTDGLIAPFLAPGNEGRYGREALGALGRARAISEALFGEGELGLAVEFVPEQPDRAASSVAVGEYALTLHGARGTYDMGQVRDPVTARWPGSRSGAALEVSTAAAPLSLSFAGDWALFRLLDRAEVRRATTWEYDVVWPLEGTGHTVRAQYLLRAETPHQQLVQDPTAFFALRLPARLSR